jgi:hypothetical protein
MAKTGTFNRDELAALLRQRRERHGDNGSRQLN